MARVSAGWLTLHCSAARVKFSVLGKRDEIADVLHFHRQVPPRPIAAHLNYTVATKLASDRPIPIAYRTHALSDCDRAARMPDKRRRPRRPSIAFTGAFDHEDRQHRHRRRRCRAAFRPPRHRRPGQAAARRKDKCYGISLAGKNDCAAGAGHQLRRHVQEGLCRAMPGNMSPRAPAPRSGRPRATAR